MSVILMQINGQIFALTKPIRWGFRFTVEESMLKWICPGWMYPDYQYPDYIGGSS